MMNYPKLSVNDDLKIDWDDHHLVVFHFFRGDGKSLQPCKTYYSVTKTINFNFSFTGQKMQIYLQLCR